MKLLILSTKYFMIGPCTLDPLTQNQLNGLIACFENNSQLQEYPGRRFGLDLEPAMQIVRPIIDAVLGQDTWRVAGGNFFETETGYRVHADTGKEGPDQVWQTFVFPLRFTPKPNVIPKFDKVKFLVLNQTWSGPAAFFLNGEDTEPNEYNVVIRDYLSEGVGNLDELSSLDGMLLEHCPHLNMKNFYGLTVDKVFQWIPGVPITFPRDRLHVSSAFPRQGVAKKLGLSIFTSRL